MKKIKLVLVAAIMLGAASAFTTRSAANLTDLYVKDNGAWVLKTQAHGFCQSSTASCTYTRNTTFHTPYQDSDFTAADTNMIWVHTP